VLRKMIEPEVAEPLRLFMRMLAPLPDEEWTALAGHMRRKKLRPGEHFVKAGGDPQPVGFVVRGLLKAWYTTRTGKEHIRVFLAENTVAAAYVALLRGDATSEVNLTALEPTELLVFDYSAYVARRSKHWAWQQIGRIVAEQAYILRERRQYELAVLSAEDRLASFLEQSPGLAARISQKDLACFLGMTPVSLSRIRGRARARIRSDAAEK
jgi:CRP-like cAMP-binding protein